MKKYFRHNSPAIIMLVSTLLISCAGSSSPRKKMPEFTGGSGEFSTMHLFQSQQDDRPAYNSGFSTGFMSIAYNGTAKDCMSVQLPSSSDAQALALITMYKPFAAALLGQFARQQPNGIVLNFSSNDGGTQRRTDYVVAGKDTPEIAVVVLWDQASSNRVAAYLQQASDLPGFSIKATSGR